MPPFSVERTPKLYETPTAQYAKLQNDCMPTSAFRQWKSWLRLCSPILYTLIKRVFWVGLSGVFGAWFRLAPALVKRGASYDYFCKRLLKRIVVYSNACWVRGREYNTDDNLDKCADVCLLFIETVIIKFPFNATLLNKAQQKWQRIRQVTSRFYGNGCRCRWQAATELYAMTSATIILCDTCSRTAP